MPYIDWPRRRQLDAGSWPCTPGELNFEITKAILNFLDLDKLNYQGINDVLGALEGAKMEFYRRVVVPYEIEKCKANGDVYI